MPLPKDPIDRLLGVFAGLCIYAGLTILGICILKGVQVLLAGGLGL